MRVYRGDECFRLFKSVYYRYCNHSSKWLKNKREELYLKMIYANDYFGIHVRTICILISMKDKYNDKNYNFDTKFWFEVFIKQVELPNEILIRNGIK